MENFKNEYIFNAHSCRIFSYLWVISLRPNLYIFSECPTCKYEWELLQKPGTSAGTALGSVTEPHSQTITLDNLVAGTYLFAVKVVEPGIPKDGDEIVTPLGVGSTVANLTVVTPPRRNEFPVVTIVPSKQTVTLPNAAVILDGSGSIDDFTDNSKLEYKWEIVTGPLGYSLDKQTGVTLKLQNLLPGNYTIMLRAKDEQGLEGNSTAFVEVLQEKDYPPSANAGGDQMVYLPMTETLVNGSASSDDHGIVEWEWTKGPEDDGLAVDMQDTRKPLLKLSGLEEGHYQFILRVVDSSGQSATSVANVYVHTPDTTPIEANAGSDVEMILPTTATILDGTKSIGITPETKCEWTQQSGPNTANMILTANKLIVNVTGLTRGEYVFQLQLWSKDATKTTKDTVFVTVTQEQNQQPKANGGGDFSVILPVSLVQVNGSSSSDDVGIVRWLWERLPTSLAAGHVLGPSATSSVLMLTDLVVGQYQWKLTVWDDQGSADTDTVSFIVKPGLHHKDQVAIILGTGIESVSAAQLANLLVSLKLLLPPAITLQMIDYSGLPSTGESSIIVLGHDSSLPGLGTDTRESVDPPSRGGPNNGVSSILSKDGTSTFVVPGVELASMLQTGISTASWGNHHLFDLPVTAIQTIICQNTCSGHGECDQVRRECVCQSWWMESWWRRHVGDASPNCDWSVVYVFVTSIVAATASVVFLWALVTVTLRRRRKLLTSSRRRGARSCWLCQGLCGKEPTPSHRRRAANGSRYTLLEEDVLRCKYNLPICTYTCIFVLQL